MYKDISHSLGGAHTSQVSSEVSLNWILCWLYSALDDGFVVSLKHGMWNTSNCEHYIELKLKLNSVALVRERTIPTERPPLVGEVGANFCG